ncbi:MAG: hypothetical protein FWC98_03465 [Bacteroidales bacterium]|nr:hypothetical protein [Bacteroidales bacterium]
MSNKTNEKIGDWLMDVAKYVITAVLVTSFLGSFGEAWKVYVVGMLIAALAFASGLAYIKGKI